MNGQQTHTKHFTNNWIVWLALHHFLPVSLVREMSSAMVEHMSHGTLDLVDLFEDSLNAPSTVSEAWVVAPKSTTEPLALYLQGRIRALVWKGDSSIFVDPQADWTRAPVQPARLEEFVSLCARFSIQEVSVLSSAFPPLGLPSGDAFVSCLKLISRDRLDSRDPSLLDDIERRLTDLDMPLRAAALKYVGDLFAGGDLWREARAIYKKTLDLVENGDDSSWAQLYSALNAVSTQSLATATRVIEGKEEAIKIYDSVLAEASNIDSALFSANSSHEVFTFRATPLDFPADNRTSILSSPLLIESHNIERPLLASLESDFPEAQRKFVARLRRQIALGASGESRIAKAYYASSIISQLKSELNVKRKKDAFSFAICLLIECGVPKALSNVEWRDDLIDIYVDEAVIDLIRHTSSVFSGARVEREMSTIELLSNWLLRLPSEKVEVASAMLDLLSELAESNDATFDAGTDVGGRSLKAIKTVGDKRPEWRSLSTGRISVAVAAHLGGKGWWTGMQAAAEIARIYANAFSDVELAALTESALQTLERIPLHFGMIAQPIQDFLTFPRVGSHIRADSTRERRTLELILRHGMGPGSDQASMARHLRMFNASLLQSVDLSERLQLAIADIKERAQHIHNSSSIANIQALLNLSAMCGESGVELALDSIKKILRSVGDAPHDFVHSQAYLPILQLAIEHDRIAASIGKSHDEFMKMLHSLIGPIENFWEAAAKSLAIFVPFSIPPSQVPNLVVIHNWTFVSLQLARVLGEDNAVERAIDRAAAAQPEIAKTVARAKALQALDAGEDLLTEHGIKTDGKAVFYLKLGNRLSHVDASTEDGRRWSSLLLEMCLQHGPHDLDMAVLVLALQCSLSLTNFEDSRVQEYVGRLGSSQDRKSNFVPLLKLLGYQGDEARKW